MVCVPCIFIPIFLWVYNRFLAPILNPIIGRFFGKKAPKKPDHAKAAAAAEQKKSCPFSGKSDGDCPAEETAQKVENEVVSPDKEASDDDDIAPRATTRVTRSRSKKAD